MNKLDLVNVVMATCSRDPALSLTDDRADLQKVLTLYKHYFFQTACSGEYQELLKIERFEATEGSYEEDYGYRFTIPDNVDYIVDLVSSSRELGAVTAFAYTEEDSQCIVVGDYIYSNYKYITLMYVDSVEVPAEKMSPQAQNSLIQDISSVLLAANTEDADMTNLRLGVAMKSGSKSKYQGTRRGPAGKLMNDRRSRRYRR